MIFLVILLALALPAVASAAEIVKSVHGFADLNFEVIEGPGADSRFKLGEYDTYVTGTLDDRTSYLSEITTEHEGADGWEVALERLWVRYEFRPELSLSIGKFHTGMGYWNRTYHHGSLLFPQIDKPATRSMFPIHTTGLLVSGREITSARLYYDLMIGNGTGSTPKTDNDDGKSVSLYVHSKAIDGVDIGLSVYHENIQAGAAKSEIGLQNGPTLEDVSLLLLSPSISARIGATLVEAEALRSSAEGDDTGFDAQGTAIHATLSHELNSWTPYVQFDSNMTEADDPFYRKVDTRRYSIGCSYHVSYLMSVKAQFRHNAPAGGDGTNDLFTQIAIGF